MDVKIFINNMADLERLGSVLAMSLALVKPYLVCYLKGGLGVGKTALVREILKHQGFSGVVVSPSFSIMEVYNFPDFKIVHLDLYRVRHMEELDIIGVTDFIDNNILFVEWPDVATRYFHADLIIDFYLHENIRELNCCSYTLNGNLILRYVQENLLANEKNI